MMDWDLAGAILAVGILIGYVWGAWDDLKEFRPRSLRTLLRRSRLRLEPSSAYASHASETQGPVQRAPQAPQVSQSPNSPTQETP